jgi:hypothetical protein
MINLADYFGKWAGHKDATDQVVDDAECFLAKVNALLDVAFADGVDSHINPATGTYISGQTLGGFRPQDCAQGAPTSSHKVGRGVDIYDPQNELDDWCHKHQDVLKRMGLHMEEPMATNRWCHLTDRAPRSNKTCFMP